MIKFGDVDTSKKKPSATSATMDQKRKSSWESKMSASTMSTRHFVRSDTPSSILSSDSDIRFTRKLGNHYRCGCYIAAVFLLFLLVTATAVYLCYSHLTTDPPQEQVFRATFRVIDGDTFFRKLADPTTEEFRLRARNYKERINLVFRRSGLRMAYVGSEVLALDGVEGNDLVVHFNVHFDPRWLRVQTSDLFTVLSNEIILEEPMYLANLTIDPNSIDVKESSAALTTQQPLSSTTAVTLSPPITVQPVPRRCGPVRLEYCNKLLYNSTSYPNKLGHKNLQEVLDNVIAFRELVDAECYRLAYEFVCQLLQPSCLPRLPTDEEDHMVLPCRGFCQEFHMGCGSRIPDKLKDMLNCNTFPDYIETGSCIPKPGCVKDLQAQALTPRVCDGVIDCVDMSDETSCSYCPAGSMHCGTGSTCISPNKRCDGSHDCPDGSDEKACLSLAPSMSALTKGSLPATPHQPELFSKGYVMFNERGHSGKVCTERLNRTVPEPNHETTLRDIASSLCTVLLYQNVSFFRVEKDKEDNVQYVHMEDPTASEIMFVRGPCPSKEVLVVGCSNLKCGLQSLRREGGLNGLGKMAAHGDWPWHVALFKDSVHVCDGTLVSPEWLVTTASCFQGQPKAEWIARLGTVRLSGAAPWQQERAVVGMVKSPVEGSTVVMVKLERPVTLSDFVHPVCLPEEGASLNLSYCNTLGWTRNRELLKRIELKASSMQSCENISIPTVNSFCSEPAYPTIGCNEEELAGSPMVCLQSDNRTWTLVGISNWRIACSKLGTERPRMYDKISSNIEWIHSTTSAVS